MRYSALALVLAFTSSLLLSGCPAVVATGVGAGVVAAEDRRTLATQAEDQGIELKTMNRATEAHKDGVHLNVTSFNRMVLLTGEVPNDKVKQSIERIARSVENVRGVQNELTVGPPTSLSTRANDSFVTSKIKARFVDAQRFNAIHVKVVTENSVAYLMGLVKRQEAKNAVEVARTTQGVKTVVTVLEYLD